MATMVPGPDPIDALETALLRVAVNPPATLREQLAEPGGLLRAVRRVLPDERTRLLLVVDQFEELFTQARDPDERDRFLAELAHAVVEPMSPLRVIATLRADHYDAPLRQASIAELVTRTTVTVRPMAPDELDRAIRLPAASVGVEVEPALASELVAGLDARSSALPLLQFSLTELFDRRVSNTMLLATHRELGGLTGALAARADRILAAGGPDDEAEARRIFGRLVTFGEGSDDTRRRALRSEFGDRERTAWLIDAFVTARLLSADRDPTTREPTIEVAHEALLRDWPRLRSWLAEDRELRRSVGAIGAAATVWDRGGRQPSDLYRGGRLDSALQIADTNPDWLRPLDREFLDASRDQADADRSLEQRRVRRLRRLVVGTAVALVVALIAGGLALTQQRRADREARAAEFRETRRPVCRRCDRASGAVAPARARGLSARSRSDHHPGRCSMRSRTAGSVVRSRPSSVSRMSTVTDVAQQRRLSDDGRWEFGVVGSDALRKDLVSGEVIRRSAAPVPCAGWWEDVETGRRWANSPSLSEHWVGSDSGGWTGIERRVSGGYLVPERGGRSPPVRPGLDRSRPVPDRTSTSSSSDAASLEPVASAFRS